MEDKAPEARTGGKVDCFLTNGAVLEGACYGFCRRSGGNLCCSRCLRRGPRGPPGSGLQDRREAVCLSEQVVFTGCRQHVAFLAKTQPPSMGAFLSPPSPKACWRLEEEDTEWYFWPNSLPAPVEPCPGLKGVFSWCPWSPWRQQPSSPREKDGV